MYFVIYLILPAQAVATSLESVIFCRKRKARDGIAAPRYLGSASW